MRESLKIQDQSLHIRVKGTNVRSNELWMSKDIEGRIKMKRASYCRKQKTEEALQKSMKSRSLKIVIKKKPKGQREALTLSLVDLIRENPKAFSWQ